MPVEFETRQSLLFNNIPPASISYEISAWTFFPMVFLLSCDYTFFIRTSNILMKLNVCIVLFLLFMEPYYKQDWICC